MTLNGVGLYGSVGFRLHDTFTSTLSNLFSQFQPDDMAVLSMVIPGGDRDIQSSLAARGFLVKKVKKGDILVEELAEEFIYIVAKCLNKSAKLKEYFPNVQIPDSPPAQLEEFMPKFHLVQALLRSGLNLHEVGNKLEVYQNSDLSPKRLAVGIVKDMYAGMGVEDAMRILKRAYPTKNFTLSAAVEAPPAAAAAASSSSAEPVRVTDVADNFEQACVVMDDSSPRT